MKIQNNQKIANFVGTMIYLPTILLNKAQDLNCFVFGHEFKNYVCRRCGAYKKDNPAS